MRKAIEMSWEAGWVKAPQSSLLLGGAIDNGLLLFSSSYLFRRLAAPPLPLYESADGERYCVYNADVTFSPIFHPIPLTIYGANIIINRRPSHIIDYAAYLRHWPRAR